MKYKGVVEPRLLKIVPVLLLIVCWTVPALAEDWPAYRHDIRRSAYSRTKLSIPMRKLWSYTSPTTPRPAWPPLQSESREQSKLDFDDALHVAMVGDRVYFGSSVDNAVHALDAATGARRWTFFTDGPVRLAPTVKDGRVYFGSDDGAVYCVNADDGSLIWDARPAGQAPRILGAGRLMSRKPVRTGVLVDGGVAYCGVGIFPDRGTAVFGPERDVAVFALDAKTGEPIWEGSTNVPLRTAAAIHASLSPQGYLLADADRVIVPCGRSIPRAYTRADGAFTNLLDATASTMYGKPAGGGGYGILIDGVYYLGTQNRIFGYDDNGAHVTTLHDAGELLATENRYFRLSKQMPSRWSRSGNAVFAIEREIFEAATPRGSVSNDEILWTYNGQNLQTMIAVGNHVVVGGENLVVVLDAATGRELWQTAVEGLVKGLAAAHGRLAVSTGDGRIHVFGNGEPPPARPPSGTPFATDTHMPAVDALAKAMAEDAGIDRGFGLVIGGDDGVRLAYALARRTGMLMHFATTDRLQAANARKMLSAYDAYGRYVLVDYVDNSANLPYPPYFANLLVVNDPVAPLEALRLVKPHGGIMYTGRAADIPADAGEIEIRSFGNREWARFVRGRLPGARDWTHQYADAGNSGSSGDRLVRGSLDLLWYGAPGPGQVHDRHMRSVAPLTYNGRVFAQGVRQGPQAVDDMPLLMSFDAYNGIFYWQREIPGAERLFSNGDCGNLAVGQAGLLVATSNSCLRLDRYTGETAATYTVPDRQDGVPRSNRTWPIHRRPDRPDESTPGRVPGSVGAWAYVGVDGSTLVGSASMAYHFSDAVFAYDLETNRLKWQYDGTVIRNSTIAIHGNTVFFVEDRGSIAAPEVADVRQLTQQQRSPAAVRLGRTDTETSNATDEPDPSPMRTVVALDLDTGRERWVREVDISDCGEWGGDWRGGLSLIARQNVVLLSGIYMRYGRFDSTEPARRAKALSAADGETLWSEAIGNHVRPVVFEDRIVGRPHAHDLFTGERIMKTDERGRRVPWSIPAQGGCGAMSASANTLFYRFSFTRGVDVQTGDIILNFIAARPGCLINAVPAAGLLLQLEASSGCLCYHPLQATFVFMPSP